MGVAGCSECNIIIDGRLVKKIEPLSHCEKCGLKYCYEHYRVSFNECSKCKNEIKRFNNCFKSCECCSDQYCTDCENWYDCGVTYHHEWKMFVCRSCSED